MQQCTWKGFEHARRINKETLRKRMYESKIEGKDVTVRPPARLTKKWLNI